MLTNPCTAGEGERGGALRPPNLEGNVTKFAPHKALKLIARGKLTFDERAVLHRVDSAGSERVRVCQLKKYRQLKKCGHGR